MTEIKPLDSDRIAKSDSIHAASDSVYAVASEIDRSNEELDDLNEALKILKDKHDLYRIKAQRAKSLMRKLATEL